MSYSYIYCSRDNNESGKDIMAYTVDCRTTLHGSRDQIFGVWSDMASYPQWDPREQELRLNGPLAVGTTGWSKQKGGRAGSDFTVVRVEPGRRWTNETNLPGGKLVIDHTLTETGPGEFELVKSYAAHGPVGPLFRLFYAREIRRENPRSFAELAAEISRRFPTTLA